MSMNEMGTQLMHHPVKLGADPAPLVKATGTLPQERVTISSHNCIIWNFQAWTDPAQSHESRLEPSQRVRLGENEGFADRQQVTSKDEHPPSEFARYQDCFHILSAVLFTVARSF
jgi:hypothetical protein